PRLTLGLNLDLGQEQGLVPVPPGADETAGWSGVAGYLRWQATPRFALAARGESFHDRDGVRTGTAQSLNEITLTPELRVTDRLILRGDARTDWSNRHVFEEGDHPADRQTTILVNVLTWF